jgi:hypothetical protein
MLTHPPLTQHASWALSDALERGCDNIYVKYIFENTFLLDDAGVYCNGVVAVE